MSKKGFVAVIALVAILAAGGLVASNMGFKLNYPLAFAGTASGTNAIGLPFNRQAGVDMASDLIADIGSGSVVNVQRFIEASDGYEVYTGVKGTPNPDFPLATGEGYFVKMSADVNYIVVGSHDPSASVSLDGPGAGSNSGTNLYSYPYHSTADMASGLISDIGSASVVNVQRFVEATDGFEVYTGVKGTPNPDFPLAPGEAYFVKMSATVNYVPSHY